MEPIQTGLQRTLGSSNGGVRYFFRGLWSKKAKNEGCGRLVVGKSVPCFQVLLRPTRNEIGGPYALQTSRVHGFVHHGKCTLFTLFIQATVRIRDNRGDSPRPCPSSGKSCRSCKCGVVHSHQQGVLEWSHSSLRRAIHFLQADSSKMYPRIVVSHLDATVGPVCHRRPRTGQGQSARKLCMELHVHAVYVAVIGGRILDKTNKRGFVRETQEIQSSRVTPVVTRLFSFAWLHFQACFDPGEFLKANQALGVREALVATYSWHVGF